MRSIQLDEPIEGLGTTVIGHLKADHRMNRCWLKGAVGDAINAVLSAAGYNLRWLLMGGGSALIDEGFVKMGRRLNALGWQARVGLETRLKTACRILCKLSAIVMSIEFRSSPGGHRGANHRSQS